MCGAQRGVATQHYREGVQATVEVWKDKYIKQDTVQILLTFLYHGTFS